MLNSKKILIIDDNIELLESLELFFLEKGFEVWKETHGSEGFNRLIEVKPDVAIIDVRLPDVDGISILEKIKNSALDTKSIIITAFQDMETTVKAIKFGAYDYVHKPIDIEELNAIVEKCINAVEDSGYFEIKDDIFKENTIIGKSKSMQDIFKLIGFLSEVKTNVLVTGESGTGKERIAKAIHYHSKFADQPFIGINCSAIVENLWESELFGFEKGSFTGAHTQKKGKFELVENGTIFLDEISEIPQHLQAKLLRVIQEKEFERVGGNQRIVLKGRVIAATNRNLDSMVKEKLFRKDLYYRLKVFEINLPPLRERKEDIPALADHIIKKINRDLGKNISKIPIDVISMFQKYHWPGNVRELENILTRAMIISKSDMIDKNCISNLLNIDNYSPNRDVIFKTLDEVERDYTQKILEHTSYNISKTSKILGITRPTLRKKIKEWKISFHD